MREPLAMSDAVPVHSRLRARTWAILPWALAACAGLSAQTLGNGRGPDVITGDLPDTFFYGTVGSTNIYAYDLGTTSCNVGNVNLRWQAGTPNHPVIAQNVYRYTPSPTGGRIEHIGLSWAKHGFLALNQSICGTCNNQSGSVLGVGCSDPYDFGLNGEQFGLGPRSEINAATGAFAYTPSAWPAVQNELSRRINIPQADVDPALNPNATYFGEAIYIAADDAAAGNAWNNASYRRVQFSSALDFPMQIAPGSQAVRTHPAIRAWKTLEPSVREAAVDVPGDGRFWIAGNAVDIGGGLWQYEYAVYNLNSDRAAGAFIVPLGPGGTAADALARIIPHHSGEPYTNAPWTSAIGASSITFATPQTFAQNANSSALRWGTMYNFRFVSPQAPANGSVALGLFKPGTGSFAGLHSVQVSMITPGGAIASATPPINDECPSRVVAHPGENRFNTLNAGAAIAGPSACADIQSDVYFSYTFNAYAPDCPGSLVFDTCGSEIDTSIAVYPGDGCPDQLAAPLACDDDSGACPVSPGASRVSIPATLGATYIIRVGSPSGARGNVVLNITPPSCVAPNGACCTIVGVCTIVQGAASCFDGATFLGSNTTCTPNPCPQPPPPPNDRCASAMPIGDTLVSSPVLTGNNYQADTEVFDTCPLSTNGQRDVWYVYTPQTSGTVVIDTCSVPITGTMDTVLSVRSGSCTGPIIACDDDTCAPTSRVITSLTAGTPYYIRVAGYVNARGEFRLRVIGGGGQVPGACCSGSICTLTTPAACAGSGQRFGGTGTLCGPAMAITPCCRADFDQSGLISPQDIFDFLNAWFLADPRAAFGTDGGRPPVVQDLFDYLNAWFLGC